MSTYAYKLLGALMGVAGGIALAITGATLDNDALVIGGTSLISAAATAIYTNGRKGTDQP